MDDKIEQIIEIFNKAENALQQVIVEAAQERDYRSVDIARSAAVSIQNIQAQLSNPAGNSGAKSHGGKPKAKRRVSGRRAGRQGYPKFEVIKDTLIRIGWSKKQRGEYTHKTPRSVFDATTKAMATLARSGAGPFAAEQLIERINSTESETVPSYQVYTVIGLLRLTNCIKQVGRDGYDIPPELEEEAERKWLELPSRKA